MLAAPSNLWEHRSATSLPRSGPHGHAQPSRCSASRPVSRPPVLLRRWRVGALLAPLLLVLGLPAALGQTCPPLQPYYPASNPAPPEEWQARLPQLEALLENCLQSAEYFALLGAARLNSGQVPAAVESLERALLLQPGHGAAQIDYAEALYLSGQLFPALELNETVLGRSDLPPALRPVIEARQQFWRGQTRRRQLSLEATAGYDTNLNNAPTRGDLTLTFGGTPVTLSVDPQFRPVEGRFGNLRAGGVWQWLTPDHQHDFTANLRGRFTGSGATALNQAQWRYGFSRPGRHTVWTANVGSSHMSFGGNALYSVGETLLTLGWNSAGRCQPALSGGLQTLHYHGQRVMDGLEASLTASLGCRSASGRQQLRVDAGGLDNSASSANRPGGDRAGWNLRLGWQYQSGRHLWSALYSHASVEDQRGYSPLLANGATRRLGNRVLLLRYQWGFAEGAALVLGLSHQAQSSNLQPFQNRGTATEVGLLLNF